MKNTGLTEQEWQVIRKNLQAITKIEKAVLFGSRAMGLARSNSDVDILLYGDNLTLHDVAIVKNTLEETTLPYGFDLVIYDVNNTALLSHINDYGQVIFDKGDAGWREVRLGEIGKIARGRSRHRPRYAKHLYDGKYPFIQTGDIKASNGRLNSHTQTYSEEGLAQSKLWPAGTMCITIAANIAETGILQYPACFPDSVIGFIADDTKCNINFIEYLFRLLKANIQRQATGSVQDNINLQTFENLYFKIPPLDEQKRIAAILSSLDDKIENNNAINKNLEEQAQAIFKSWFVDFEPFKDGEFEDSELGKIPKGWRVGKLGEIAVINKSLYAQKEEWNYVNYLDTSNITKGVISEIQYLDCSIDKIPSRAKRKVEKNDIVFSTVRPNQLHYGILGSIKENMLVSTGFSVISSTENISYQHIYIYLTQIDVIEKLQQIAEQSTSTFPAIRPQDISSLNIIVAPASLEKRFNNLTSPIFEKIQNLQQENQKLTELRDSLLPKLMSGELRVPVEAE